MGWARRFDRWPTSLSDEGVHLLFDAVVPVGDVHMQTVITAGLVISPLTPLVVGLQETAARLGDHMVHWGGEEEGKGWEKGRGSYSQTVLPIATMFWVAAALFWRGTGGIVTCSCQCGGQVTLARWSWSDDHSQVTSVSFSSQQQARQFPAWCCEMLILDNQIGPSLMSWRGHLVVKQQGALSATQIFWFSVTAAAADAFTVPTLSWLPSKHNKTKTHTCTLRQSSGSK